MALLNQRVLHDSTDLSVALNDFETGSSVIDIETTEALYIGCEVPFNNLWFDVLVANAVAATVSVYIWFGNAWVAAVDIIDETKSSDGKTMAADGRLQWNTNILKGWDKEQYSSSVTGLSSAPVIYNMYWVKISFSANLTDTFSLDYVGQKLCTSTNLFRLYPDLNKTAMMSSYESGLTTWDKVIYTATDEVVRDLKAQGKIWHRGQILDHTVWTTACVHKTAEIIYNAMGSAYENRRILALDQFDKAMKVGFSRLDSDLSGTISGSEKRNSSVYISR